MRQLRNQGSCGRPCRAHRTGGRATRTVRVAERQGQLMVDRAGSAAVPGVDFDQQLQDRIGKAVAGPEHVGCADGWVRTGRPGVLEGDQERATGATTVTVVAPVRPSAPRRCLTGEPGRPRTIIWLDHAQNHLLTEGSDLGSTSLPRLRTLLTDPDWRPMLALATTWPTAWDQLRCQSSGGLTIHTNKRRAPGPPFDRKLRPSHWGFYHRR
jgi:hypothetical protein